MENEEETVDQTYEITENSHSNDLLQLSTLFSATCIATPVKLEVCLVIGRRKSLITKINDLKWLKETLYVYHCVKASRVRFLKDSIYSFVGIETKSLFYVRQDIKNIS